MIKGTTESGFEFKIDESALDDYELLELFSEVDENPLIVPKVIKKMLGKKQKDRLVEHIRDENGIAKASALTKELGEILKASKDLKNS